MKRNFSKYTDNKSKILGMNFSKASYKLMRKILYNFVCETGNNSCFRCGLPILLIEDLSIEHKEAWQNSEKAIELYFDLSLKLMNNI